MQVDGVPKNHLRSREDQKPVEKRGRGTGNVAKNFRSQSSKPVSTLFSNRYCVGKIRQLSST